MQFYACWSKCEFLLEKINMSVSRCFLNKHRNTCLWFHDCVEKLGKCFFATGSGAYVVIDKRTKAADDAQENSSDDGNMFCVM